MKIKTYLTHVIPCVLCLFMSANVNAQDFNRVFSDSTLRIDYIFSGNANQQHIAVDQPSVIPRWYGKKQRLAELPMGGNGQITVCDHHTRCTLCRNSFSTLFQEWLTHDGAKHTNRAFENVFLVPMLKNTVDVTITLNNNRRGMMVRLTHTVASSDILIEHTGERNRIPFETLQTAHDTPRCIHIAFLAEGCRTDEMDVFLKDAAEATEALFAHEPFRAMRNRFNIIVVRAPSAESGTSEPSEGVWKNTTLHSHSDTFYSNRYLTTLRLETVHDWLAGLPYEHIIILVNTHQYGGGGILNSHNLSITHHPSFKPVVVHEFGHSFAGLADECAYDFEEIPMCPPNVEPWEQNITTEVKFSDKRQDTMEKVPSMGLTEGAGYSPKGIYRASHDCRMRTNDTPEFCPVCQQVIQRVINFYTK